MTISDAEKIDFLWKKVIYGVSKTAGASTKFGSNETVASPLTVYSRNVWTQGDSTNIPSTPPASTTSAIQVYYGANRIKCTVDPTAPTNQTWFATSSYGDITSRMGDFIPTTFGSNYLVRVFVGDPQTTGVRIYPDTTGYEYVFDYVTGTLNFNATIPANVGTNGIYIQVYQYVGSTLTSSLTNTAKSYVVADITARNALSPLTGDRAHVLDASGIATDASPGRYADYIWDGSSWVVTSTEDTARSEQNLTLSHMLIPSDSRSISLGTVGQNARAVEITVEVFTAFDGDFEISIGDSGNSSRLLSIAENDLQYLGTYVVTSPYQFPSGADTELNIYVTGTADIGSAKVTVTFA